MHSSLLLSILIYTLTLFFSHITTGSAYINPLPPYYSCSTSSNNTNYDYSPNNTYHTNLKILLSWLSSNATPTTHIYNTTITESNTDNTIYGLFMCHVVDEDPDCKNCVTNAAKQIVELCPMSKEATIYAVANCMVRYSNRYFFTTVEENPKLSFMNQQDYVGPQVGRFNKLLWDTLNIIRNLAANNPNGSMKYAFKSVNIIDNQTLYAMGYCIQYLSSDDCSWCLSDAMAQLQASCCSGKTGGRVYFPSCGLRFELYPFDYSLASWTTNQLPELPTTTIPLSTLASPGFA